MAWGNTASASSHSPTLVEFDATEEYRHQKFFGKLSFESAVLKVTESGNSSSISSTTTSKFAKLVLERAANSFFGEKSHGDQENRTLAVIEHPDLLPGAIIEAFSSVYRVALAKLAFEAVDLPTGSSIMGTMQTPSRRLFVNYTIAGYLLGFTILSLCSTVWLSIRRLRMPSPLTAEPTGALSYVTTMCGKDKQVRKFLEDITRNGIVSGDAAGYARSWWTMDTARFYFVDSDEVEGRKDLCAENLEKRTTKWVKPKKWRQRKHVWEGVVGIWKVVLPYQHDSRS